MKRGHEAIGVDREEMDITNAHQVKQVIKEQKPEGVIHCAAYTAVDRAEEDEEQCRRINVDGTKNLVDVCKEQDITMLYLSTDYIFDGQGEHFREPEGEAAKPLNVYGQTKYEGEQVIVHNLSKYFIVRISWVFGFHGNNFIKTMLRLGKEQAEVNVVKDQVGSPTYTKDLACLLVDMMETKQYGIYHASNEGVCSWYEFACEIFKQAEMAVKVNPVDSHLFQAKAQRPYNSRMSKDKLEEKGFKRLPDWKDALQRYLEELRNSDEEQKKG